jgi:hypothetical protein
MKNAILLLACLFLMTGLWLRAEDALRVTPVPDAERSALRLAPYYKKFVSASGIPIVSSDKPSDFALLEAAWILNHMLAGRDDVRDAIIKSRTRLAVMAYNEFTTDIPEHSDLTPKTYWDRRARGLGASADRPAVSCGEENLLCYPGDPYKPENILVHEFGHVIHEMGMNKIDPTFDKRLRDTYAAAKREGLWKGTYASTNHHEYWAEGVQSWFDTNDRNNAEHGDIDTREKLQRYDPRFAKLLAEVFRDNDWRYSAPTTRSGDPHLAGFEPGKSPHFIWPKERTNKLPRLVVSAAPPAHSPQADRATTIVFRNQTGGEVEIDWIDFKGARKPYLHLRPKMSENMETFAGHAWVVKAEDGREIAAFVAANDAAEAVIEEPKPAAKK